MSTFIQENRRKSLCSPPIKMVGGKSDRKEERKENHIPVSSHHLSTEGSKDQRPNDPALLSCSCQLHEGWNMRGKSQGASLPFPATLLSKCLNTGLRAQAPSTGPVVTEIRIDGEEAGWLVCDPAAAGRDL